MKEFYLIFILVAVLAGCKKDDSEKKDDNGGDCTNTFVSRNDSIIVTGCSDYEPTLNFVEAGYIFTIKEKSYGVVNNVQIYEAFFDTYTSVKASSASALTDDGWYTQSSIFSHSAGEWQYKITATGEYQVIFAKLPVSKTAVNLPVEYSGAGQQVLGPVHISGETTFKINCPDAKQAGLAAELFDAVSGEELLDEDYHSILGMINLDGNSQQINNYSKSITLNLSEGNYLLRVSANSNANWTFEIN